MAEASAGLSGWPEHLQSAVDAAPNAAASLAAARMLARALNRAQRFTDAIDVLDRAASALDDSQLEFALPLEAAAVVAGMNDPATASMAFRRQALRDRAVGDQAVPADVLAAASLVSVLGNDPAEIGARLATRALAAEELDDADSDDRAWFSPVTFGRAAHSLVWTERYLKLRPLVDASIAQARLTGDGGRLALGLASRGWLALRRGDLSAAEADGRTALSASELPAPPTYRVLNGGVLLKALVEQGELDAAEEALAPLDSQVENGFVTGALLRLARGRLRVARGRTAEGLDDFLAVGACLTRAMVHVPRATSRGAQTPRSPSARSVTATTAGHLAAEELELAQGVRRPARTRRGAACRRRHCRR